MILKHFIRYSTALLILIGFQTQVLAHPHVWVQVHTEVVYGENETIVALRHHWTFDEMYTAFAVQGLDRNGDKIYDKEELKPLLKVNIDSLGEFNYFTHSMSGENTVTHAAPENEQISLSEKQRLVFTFTLPLSKPVKADAAAYSFSVYDPSYYVSFDFKQDMPLKLASTTLKGCKTEVTSAKQNTQKLMQMSEADFQKLGVNMNFSQFASKVVVRCAVE